MLVQRANGSGLTERQLMHADFVLYMRGCLDTFRYEANMYHRWWPETLLYADGRAFEIFARAQSPEYLNKLKCLLDIAKKEDLEPALVL